MEALMGGHNLEPAPGEDQKNLQEQRDEKYGHSSQFWDISLALKCTNTKLNWIAPLIGTNVFSCFLLSIKENITKTANPVSFFDAHLNI